MVLVEEVVVVGGDGSGPKSKVGGGGPPGFDDDHAFGFVPMVQVEGGGGGAWKWVVVVEWRWRGPSRVGGGGPPVLMVMMGLIHNNLEFPLVVVLESCDVCDTKVKAIEGWSSITARSRGGSSTTIKGGPHSHQVTRPWCFRPTRISSKEKVDKGERILPREHGLRKLFYGQGHLSGRDVRGLVGRANLVDCFLHDRPYGYSSTGSNMVEYSTDSSYRESSVKEYSRSQYYGNWNDPQAYSLCFHIYCYFFRTISSLSLMEIGMLHLASILLNLHLCYLEQYAPPRHSYGDGMKGTKVWKMFTILDHSVDMPPLAAWGTQMGTSRSRPLLRKLGIRLLVTFNQDVMFGGTTTVALAIEWTMTELMKNPEDLMRVQRELSEVVGQDRRVQESDLDELTYLKCVIKETLRLHPPIPLLLHETSEDAEVVGYYIPARTRVVINSWAIGRDKTAWDDPEAFNPSRFLNKGAAGFKGNNFEFIPFGSGRRSCPGMNLGHYAVQLAVAHLLHCFSWELPNGMKPSDLDVNDLFGLSAPRESRLVAVPSPRPHSRLF
ncbi:hypothetical protein IFM89_005446 [Coptis chinensis]|uniref:Cytochrome P450 n=1 Tax=Coptis chinensis TaxID=261450 RepID=A0A835MHF4_9MAGN|nr:hypothetical protein IFM89_005446 [Coptis chinensis]